MIYNGNRSTGLHIMLSWFLKIISESAREQGLMFSGLTIEIPELRH